MNENLLNVFHSFGIEAHTRVGRVSERHQTNQSGMGGGLAETKILLLATTYHTYDCHD